jgi:hypothetical protein
MYWLNPLRLPTTCLGGGETSRAPPCYAEGGGRVLQNLSDQARLCYERAAEAKERAERMRDPRAKADFLNIERRWLLLARIYEFGERLDDFTHENMRQAERGRAITPVRRDKRRLTS